MVGLSQKILLGLLPWKDTEWKLKVVAKGTLQCREQTKMNLLCWDLQIPIYKAYHLKDLSLFHFSMLKVIEKQIKIYLCWNEKIIKKSHDASLFFQHVCVNFEEERDRERK